MSHRAEALALGAVLACGCGEGECDLVFLRSDGADMPVNVCGDTSQAVILFLHGGPGGGAEVTEEYLDGITDQFAVAHWSQRAAGSSQGNPARASMTLEQFHLDTHRVVTLLRALYDDPSIFVMGHSWGGAVAAGYLLEYPHDDIAGWLHVNADHSVLRAAELSRQWVETRARDRIARGEDAAHWRRALRWYERTGSPQHYVQGRHFGYVDELRGEFFGEPVSLYGAGDFLSWSGRATGFDILVGMAVSYQELWVDEAVGLDYTPRLAELTLPVAMLWGEHDGIDPVGLAFEAYDALGTSPRDKQVRVFERSGHFPMIEQEAEFAAEAIAFVDAYR